MGSNERRVVHEHLKRPPRGRDLQRGRRARPLRRRRAAGRRLSAAPAPSSDPTERRSLEALVELLATEPAARQSRRREPPGARTVHVADSPQRPRGRPSSAAARRSPTSAPAPGFPGLVLAAALPDARVDLIESVARKCEFMRARDRARRARQRRGRLRARRGAGRRRRAARPTTPSPRAPSAGSRRWPSWPRRCSRDGGALVAWKGRRDADEEAELGAPADAWRWSRSRSAAVSPYAGSRDRHIHLLRKNGPTPNGLPRRPGWRRSVRSGSERLTTPDRRPRHAADGNRLRDREPEGRRRARRRPPSTSAPASPTTGRQTLLVDLDAAVQRDRRARRSTEGRRRPPPTTASPARSRSPRRPGPAGPDNLWIVPANARPRRRLGRAAAHRAASRRGCATGSARSASASPPRCSTARRRSARSPSTRSSPPTG